MARKTIKDYDIVDALGNRIETLKKSTSANYIGITGVRYKRGYSSGMYYEIRKR